MGHVLDTVLEPALKSLRICVHSFHRRRGDMSEKWVYQWLQQQLQRFAVAISSIFDWQP